MTACDVIFGLLPQLECEETSDGARVVTQCLYPNFEQVAVFIQRHLDGFLVHDAGEGYDLAFLEARNPNALKAHMREFAALYGVDCDDHRIFGRAKTADWLPNVVMAVANASAAATNALVVATADVSAEDREFREQAYDVLQKAFRAERVPRRVKRRGRTGKLYTFAFGVVGGPNKVALVDTVTPNPISVASRFTSFSAVRPREAGGGYLTYNRPLAYEDSALLSEVADVLPLEALVANIERGFHAGNVLQ